MSIIISNSQQVEGFNLLWDDSKTQKMIGEDKYLHVSTPYKPEKNVRDCKIGLMKNKDPKIIKLRDKLFQEDTDEVLPVMEALSNPEITLEEFISLYGESSVQKEIPKQLQEDEKDEENIVYKVDKEEEDEDSIWAEENLFKGTGSLVDEVAVGSDTETVVGDYMGDINVDEIPDLVGVDDVEPEEEEIVEINNSPTPPPIPDIENVRNKIEWDKLYGELEDMKEEINTLNNTILELTDELLAEKKGDDKQVDIDFNLNDIEKLIKQGFESIESNRLNSDNKNTKSISGDERELINNYSPPDALKQFLKRGDAIKKYNEGIIKYKGLEIMQGAEEVIDNDSEGLYEFICKYFPFIILEYKNEVLNKIESRDE